MNDEFNQESVAKELGILDADEASQVAEMSARIGRLPNTFMTYDKYYNGCDIMWHWFDFDTMTEETLKVFRDYSVYPQPEPVEYAEW